MGGLTATDSILGQRSYLSRIRTSDVRRRYFKNKLGMVSATWIVLFVLAVAIGPHFTQDPNLADPPALLQTPSLHHLFGTDDLGRDIFSRVLVGGRISLVIGITATVIPVIIGMIIGTLSGYRGGILDDLLARFFDILLIFPTLLLGLVLGVSLGPSEKSVIIALSISQIPVYGRLFRAGALSAKSSEYVQAVVALGISPVRIVARHVLPNTAIPVLIIATSHIGNMAIAEASLSFLGAGIQPPRASLGNMISEGQAYLQIVPLFALLPGVILTLVSLSFSFIGDALRDAFDVRDVVMMEETAVIGV
jgi:peptide/nickel transport system permease protein